MNKRTYQEVIDQLTEHRKGVSEEKRVDYTRSSEDVLANFKNVAESTGVTPLQVWLVYTQKHFDAIANYCKTEGESESEPIKERFGDLLNYAELGWALVKESQQKVPSFCDTPEACYHDGCMCDRTNKFVEDTKKYELLEDIDGLGEKGSIIEVSSCTDDIEYVDSDKALCCIHLESDSGVKEVDELKSTGRSAGI